MPVFVYRAADRRGQTIDGVMEAPDAHAVVERLQKDAYFPIRVAPHAERAGWLAFGVSSRVSQRDLLAFTQQLATLVEAGLPLDRALAIQEELASTPRVKAIVTDLLNSVRGGSSLSEALAKHHPRPFSRLYINMVRAGEKGGVLEVTLRRLAEFLESRAAFAEALVSALAYPVVIFSVGIGAIVFLMTFVIPRFATIFADRKSTRLNSSHPSISYAVFCLKQKSPHLGRMPNMLSRAWVSTDQGEIRVGKSMDQVLAQHFGKSTAIPSLVLGVEPTELRLEDGLSMIYGSSISWASDTKPATKEIYPSRVFDLLVGDPRGRTL